MRPDPLTPATSAPGSPTPASFPVEPLDEVELLDSGHGEKLERFGPKLLRRPDPQALWRPRLDEREWRRADLTFVRESDRGGRFEDRRGRVVRDAEWTIGVLGAHCVIRPTPFKHVGLFPEQATNWRALERWRRGGAGEDPELLNLFGYSGVASVLAAQAGYRVTHVDASKAAIAWTRDNARASGLPEDALRVVCEDALRFAEREVRRGRRYRAILLDPPAFGRGPKGERWQLEQGLAPLLETVRALADERCLVVLSAYAVGFSPLAFLNLFAEFEGGRVAAGELVLAESERASLPSRLLPCGFCARWVRGAAPDFSV
jgi:23S rRNA (cytosine1962-C5)-methyltransferase